MRFFGLSLAFWALASLPVIAAPGDQWILGIHHFDQDQSFTEYVGAGYSGPHSSGEPNFFGNAYGHSGGSTGGEGDISRVYWELDGYSVNSGRRVPQTPELYTIEFFGTAEPANDDWQPIESRYHGQGHIDHGGEQFPIDDHIPWAGAFGSNHQYIGPDPRVVGEWNATGPGPQAPSSASFNAHPFGEYMWLTRDSWLYAKWDFPYTTNRSWTALRLTQITGDPEPDLDGDFNEDGLVDAADYALWRKTGEGGEFGYNIWRTNFGMTVGTGSGTDSEAVTVVPEPAAGELLLMAIAGFAIAVAMKRAAPAESRAVVAVR